MCYCIVSVSSRDLSDGVCGMYSSVVLCCLISNTRLSPHNYYANLCVKEEHQQVARLVAGLDMILLVVVVAAVLVWRSGDRTGFPLYYL